MQVGALLFEVRQLHIAGPANLPLMGQHALQDTQQRGFSNAVVPHDAPLFPTAHLKGERGQQRLAFRTASHRDINVLHLQQFHWRVDFIGKPHFRLFLRTQRFGDALHLLQLLHTALGTLRRGGTCQVSCHVVLQLGDLFLLHLVFFPLACHSRLFELGKRCVISLVLRQCSLLDLANAGAEAV